MSLRKILATLAIACCLVLTTLSISYLQNNHQSALENARKVTAHNAQLIASELDNLLTIHQKSVALASKIPVLSEALETHTEKSIAAATSLLNDTCTSLNAALCYVLDMSGSTVLENSNSQAASLLGNNYGFRPYFKQAKSFGQGLYMALGVTTKKRGIYISQQVRNPQGKGLGVLVVKLEAQSMEERYQQEIEDTALLIDPNGVIFASTKTSWILHSLWVLPSDISAHLTKDKQFGQKPLGSLEFKADDKGFLVGPEKQKYLISRVDIAPMPGWEVIALKDTSMLPSSYSANESVIIGFALIIMVTSIAVIFLYRIGRKDTDKRHRAELELKESKARLQQLIELSNEAILIHHEGRIIDANDIAASMFGYDSIEQLRDFLLWELFATEDVATLRKNNAQNNELPYEVYARTRDGKEFPVEICAKTSFIHDQQVRVCCIRDITERRQQQEKMLYQAHYDNLTGLPNRNLMIEKLQQAMNHTDTTKQQTAIMFIDLDDFKKINDTVGHSQGDELICAAGQRLTEAIREKDTLCRYGGDEFVVIMEQITHKKDIENVAERILLALSREFVLGHNQLLYISGSIGIAAYPDDGATIDALMQRADTAMYCSKEFGRNSYHFFTPEMNKEVHDRIQIEQNLRTALENNEFEVHYQPIYRAETLELMGAEALLRWNNPQLGQVPPDRFIPIAEQNGLIVPIGEWVFNQAFGQTKQWQDSNLQSFKISINISPRQFRHPNIAYRLERALRKAGLSPSSVCIEITEGILMKNDLGTTQTFNTLKRLGLKFSLDDFGTGYSSLSYLKTFPFDHLKIDRSFVSDLVENTSDQQLIEATLAMCKGLGLMVIAEGVETEEQLAFLKERHCFAVQGFYLSQPVSAEKFTAEIIKPAQAHGNSAYI